MHIGKDLVAAAATPLVLGILAEGESYGYAILRRVGELSDGRLEWSDGMLYPLLHRLERLGHVEATWGASPSMWRPWRTLRPAASLRRPEPRTRGTFRHPRLFSATPAPHPRHFPTSAALVSAADADFWRGPVTRPGVARGDAKRHRAAASFPIGPRPREAVNFRSGQTGVTL